MDAENTDSCSQRDSAERKGYVRAHCSFNRIWKERDSAQPELLEKILYKDNLNRAFKRVKANKGAPGVDGMTIEETARYLKENQEELIGRIKRGKYTPSPVRRVEIPKPDGGVRKLGIPTVTDRVLQQAITQLLTPIYEPKFADGSYGYRPGRSAKDAVLKVKEYAEQGYTYAVVLDLSKYFDTLNHTRLLNILREDVKDERVIQMIKRYLKSGVMENGVVMETAEGSPQGGNLSPLLANETLTGTATVTSVTTEATATEAGSIVYTATVTINGVEYTDTVTVVIPATGETGTETENESGTETESGDGTESTTDTSSTATSTSTDADSDTGSTGGTAPKTSDVSTVVYYALLLGAAAVIVVFAKKRVNA